MGNPKEALQYADSHQQEAVDDLIDLLRIPSVSTLSEHKADMEQAAAWLFGRLSTLGFKSVQIMETRGHPVVYGEMMAAGPEAPTIMVYGHYDVQPADPLELWESGPFDPQIRGDDLYARGASDMKGQVVAHLKAAEALIRTSGLPVNLKYMIEGEEEIGSPNLEQYIRVNADILASDFCLNLDSNILGPDIPSVTYALRGLAYFEIRVQGPRGDLHSGIFGGAVVNPANSLAQLIAGMHDADHRVTLPGFYDDVRPLSEEERKDLADLPQADQWWSKQAGVEELDGETGYSATERATARPTLDVNGFLSGFTGEGSKTVLPAKAMAKVSCRLVANQDPKQIEASMVEYLKRNAPRGVTWEVDILASAVPALIDRDSPQVQAASRALEAVWGVPARFKREGGTVPVVGMIEQLLGLKTLMMGFGLPDDNLHAPNEKFHLPNFHRGIKALIHFMSDLGS